MTINIRKALVSDAKKIADLIHSLGWFAATW